VSWIALKKPTKGGKIFIRPFFVKIIGFIFNWFDIIFAFSLIISCGSLSCRWIQVPDLGGLQVRQIGVDFGNSDNTNIVNPNETGFRYVHVNFINDDAMCLNLYDMLMKIFGIVLLASCFVLKLLYYRLRQITISPLIS
jgi:hypothetical protein